MAFLERELKLTAETDAALDQLVRLPSLGAAELGPPTTVEESDTYLDTDDGRLVGARWACRLRERRGRRWISLKGPAEHAAGDAVHRRPELEGPVGADPGRPAEWPPSPARDLVLELAGSGPLRAVVVLLQSRTERDVRVEAARVANLSLDRVEVVADGAGVGRLRVVELELDARAVATGGAAAAIQALLAVKGLRPDPASKLEHALAMLGRARTRS